MRRYEPDDEMVSLYVRIPNVTLPIVPPDRTQQTDEYAPVPLRAPTRLRTLTRRRRRVLPLIVGYGVSVAVWAGIGAAIAVRM